MIPYSRFSRIVWTDRRDRSIPVSPKLLFSNYENLKLPKIVNDNESGLFLICLRNPSVSKQNTIGFGAKNHVQKSRNHETDGFPGFPNNEIGKLLVQSEAE